MEIISPWALAALLYVLGGLVVMEDMREADRQEPWMSDRFRAVTYIVCVGLWPLLVLIIILETIYRKVKP